MKIVNRKERVRGVKGPEKKGSRGRGTKGSRVGAKVKVLECGDKGRSPRVTRRRF